VTGTARSILFAHPSDEAYGADRVLLQAVVELAGRGWAPVVVLPDDTEPGWLSSRLAEAGVPVRRGPLAVARRRYLSPRHLPGYLGALLAARAFLSAEASRTGATIIHVNTSALLVAAVLGRPGGAGLVWHVHEIVIRPRALAWLFRVLPPLRADRVIAVSDAVRRNLTRWRWARSRVVVVRNGIPPRPGPLPDRSGEHPLTVAYVGRLNRWKGYEVFVDAAARLARRYPTARFVIAGDPPLGEEWRSDDLTARIAAAGLGDRVERLGRVADGAAVFDAADIAVVPSTWPDPLPTVVLEAMRAGCAVVASDHGGAPEMIERDRSGLLVPPGDPAALADAIASLLDDAALRQTLGAAAARRVASTFTVARSVAGLEAAYGAVLERRGSDA
jgi:glycosyltransferase involved in cell wall biosynthesis